MLLWQKYFMFFDLKTTLTYSGQIDVKPNFTLYYVEYFKIYFSVFVLASRILNIY